MKDPRLSERGRQMLEQSLDQINALRNASPRDPNFKEWRQSTLTLIQRIWEGDQVRSTRFRRIPFSPPSSRADRHMTREWYEKGAAEAASLLRALIDELSGGASVAEYEEAGPPALEQYEEELESEEPPAVDEAKPGPAIPRVPRPGAARPTRRDDDDDEDAPAPKRLAELRALIGRDTPAPRASQRPRDEEPPQFDEPQELAEPPRDEEPPRAIERPRAAEPRHAPPARQTPPAGGERSGQGGSVTSRPNGKNKHKKASPKARLKDMLGFGDDESASAPAPPAREIAPEPVPPPRPAPPQRPAPPAPRATARPAAPRPPRLPEPAPRARAAAPPPDDIASVLPPEFGLPPENRLEDMPKGWPNVAREPEPFEEVEEADEPATEEWRSADEPEAEPEPELEPEPEAEPEPEIEDLSPFADSAPTPPVDEAMLRAALEAALGPMSAPPEETEESADDMLGNSPVFRAQGKPIKRRSAAPPTPHAPSPVVSAAAAAVLAMAAEVGSLGVPDGQRTRARSALLDLARHLEHHDLTWDVLREAVAFAMEYPAIGRRVLPLLLPYLEEAA